MAAFQEGRIQVLVATTVIEVGIDIANAGVILIEHADRFRARPAAPAARAGRPGSPSILLLPDGPSPAHRRGSATAGSSGEKS